MEKLLLIGKELANDIELHRLLEREEYDVSHADDEASGLVALGAERPAMAFVDHHLQASSGVDVLKEIRRQDPSCEVVFVTPGGDMDAAIEVLRAGALDYLYKPIDPEQLRVTLGRGRERRRERQLPDVPVILVIEDHEPTRRHVARILTKEGYRVLVAADGAEGIDIFHDKRVDLILSDLRMPVKDGLAVLRETRGAGADVEAIMITGHGDEDAVIAALREGAINFLKKPIDIDQMLLAIEKALEHQRLRRSLAYRNRDIELMQELVVRLTSRLELVVQSPSALSDEAVGFLRQLVDALPFGIVVVADDHRVIFANRHVTDKSPGRVKELSPDWLAPVGVNVDEETLKNAFSRVIEAKPGTIERLQVSKWAFLVMTPLRLVKPDRTDRYLAFAIRGERRQPSNPASGRG